MKKKTNSGEETLRSIRRNTAYHSSRILSLFFTVVLVFSFISIAYLISLEFPKSEKAVILLLGALLGGLSGVSIFHFLHAHYDQSDALIQVAKFQERSLRRRNDALSLVEKIREEVEEENREEIEESKKEISDPDETEKKTSSDLSEEPKSTG
jgi:ABC-type transport system involved in multi-copper enzyme maturation permease subunit